MWTGERSDGVCRKLPGLYAARVEPGDEVTAELEGGRLGRIKVSVPAVFDQDDVSQHVWARPCFPGGHFYIPAPGEYVWVAFEGGDPMAPVWLGVFYTPSTRPAALPKEPRQVAISAEKIFLTAQAEATLSTGGTGLRVTQALVDVRDDLKGASDE